MVYMPEIKSSHRGWVGIDWDGTLVTLGDEDYDPESFGEFVPEMSERVKQYLIEDVHDVKIMTARVAMPVPKPGDDQNVLRIAYDDMHRARKAIQLACLKEFGVALPVVASKDRDMVALYDDRAFQVQKNTGKIIGHYEHEISHVMLPQYIQP